MRSHKNIRSMFTCMLALLLSLSFVLPFYSKTAEAAETTYTVRVFSGERGSFSGKAANEVKVFDNLTYGSEFSFSGKGLKKNTVKLIDGKYYVRGFRESGKDNNTVGLESFTVTQDIDYVVAYGIAGSTVEYYVNYVDEDGNQLAPSDTYYGNVGDKPVVAYEYIDGYYPQARNLTKTLSGDATENNFTFVYRRITRETETEITDEANESRQESDDTDTTTDVEQQSGTTDAANGNTDDAAAATTAAPAGDTGIATTEDMPDNPDEVPDLVDIDDQETPLADFDGSGSDQSDDSAQDVLGNANPRTPLSTPVKIGIGICAIAAIAAAAGALYYFLVYKTDDEDDEDSDDDSDDDSE